MKKTLLVIIALPVLLFAFTSGKKKSRLLIFSKTAGYRHASILAGKPALLNYFTDKGFITDTSEDASMFTDESLKKYNAVIFLNTTGDILNEQQQGAFERFIRSGKGFVGIHAATDTEYDWPWYAKLVGANFESHPKPQQATLVVTDPKHASTKELPATWSRMDEWYNFKNQNTDVHVVLSIDEKSYTGGKNGNNHPMSWYHEYDGGKAFYTALGHTDSSYNEPAFLQHLLGGLKYTIAKSQ